MEENQNLGPEPIITDDEQLALTSPEGTYKYVPKEEKTPEQITAEQEAAAKAEQERKATELIAQEEERLKALSPEARAKEEERLRGLSSTQPVHQPFLLLQKAFPGLELPDLTKVNEENAANALVQTVISNYNFGEIFDPKVLEIQRKIDEGVPFSEAVTGITSPSAQAALTGDDLLIAYYKDNYDLDDEEAKQAVAETQNKTIESKKARKYFEEKAKEEKVQYENRLMQQQEQEWTQTLQSINQDVEDLLVKAENFTDIWGIEISKADRDNFKPLFKKLAIPESPNEPSLIHQILENDEVLYQVAYSLVHGRNLVNELKLKPEEVRAAIEKRLLEVPDNSTKNSRKVIGKNEENTFARFAEPEPLVQ